MMHRTHLSYKLFAKHDSGVHLYFVFNEMHSLRLSEKKESQNFVLYCDSEDLTTITNTFTFKCYVFSYHETTKQLKSLQITLNVKSTHTTSEPANWYMNLLLP